MSNEPNSRPKRAIVKLRNLVGKTFSYSDKWTGTSKYGEFIAFGNDAEILFVSESHKAFESAKEAPTTGTLSVLSHLSKNGRTYFTLTAAQ
jgi:hypothetical protein